MFFFFFKQKTAYEMRISDWSSDVCSSDLAIAFDEKGIIYPNIRFPVLAAHIWFSETNTPLSHKTNFPALGIYKGIAYALLYNGILGDKSVNGDRKSVV